MIAMLVLFGDSAPQALPVTPKPAPGPDYAGLVDILIDLQSPDNAGEITITAEEAARIRHACWSARRHLARSPLLASRSTLVYKADFANLGEPFLVRDWL
jgi:hypothetical protein